MATMLERIRELQAQKEAAAAPQPVRIITTTAPKKLSMTAQEALQVFGHTSFRPGQEEAVNEVLNGRNGVLAVFPTGFGKSLLYQLPSLMSDNLTVVVSPLISLMKDQVDKLQSLGVNAIFINSSVPINDVKVALAEVQSGGVKALYVAPERFNNTQFSQMMQGIPIDIFAIDEAHCISRWGHDFRPSYTELGGVIEKLNPRQIVALTATATTRVQDDICEVLGLKNAKRFIQSVYRPNLQLAVLHGYGGERNSRMADVVKDFIRDGDKTGIVYSATRKNAEEICSDFKRRGVEATVYHAGLADTLRTKVQEEWAENGGVIIATCAFGMGIDRPDVRFVIHSGLSQSIEDWYQEIGRAGRDGKNSLCLSFWDYDSDYRTQMFLIDLTNPSAKDVEKFWKWIRSEAGKVAKAGDTKVELAMTQKTMGDFSGCVNVGGCIAVLKNENLVKTLGRGSYEVRVDRERVGSSALDKIRADKIEKLDNVVAFYKYKGCKYQYICNYFGDDSLKGKPCGNCDSCG